MNNSIENDFDRMSLHDAIIDGIKRSGNRIVIDLSHGYLSNYNEIAIKDAIMFSEAVLTLYNVTDEIYKSQVDEKNVEILKPDKFEEVYNLIVSNSIVEDASASEITIGLIREDYKERNLYVEWTIYCEHVRLEWSKHILHKDWLAGTAEL